MLNTSYTVSSVCKKHSYTSCFGIAKTRTNFVSRSAAIMDCTTSGFEYRMYSDIPRTKTKCIDNKECM